MLTTTATIQAISLEKIVPSPYQTRKNFDPEKLQELAATLKEHGLMNAINVRPAGDKFELIAGERRLRAAQILGWETIDAKVEEVTDGEAAERVVVENLQREDLNPIEQAEGYKRLQVMGISQQEIAEKVGEDQPTIARYLALLELPTEIQQFMSQDIISETQIRYLGRIKDTDLLIATTQKAASEGWSVKETERQVNALLEGSDTKKKSKKSSKTLPELQWRGEDIVINRRFHPAKETKTEFIEWLSGALDPMILAMPGLKDSPKTEEARLKAIQTAAEKRNAAAQSQLDEALGKMTPEDRAALVKQFNS